MVDGGASLSLYLLVDAIALRLEGIRDEMVPYDRHPEAALAREAELCYATVAMVTDYDSWREGDAVDVAAIVAILRVEAARAAALVTGVAAGWSAFACRHDCGHALDHAIITDRAKWPPATVAHLDGIAGRVLR